MKWYNITYVDRNGKRFTVKNLGKTQDDAVTDLINTLPSGCKICEVK